MTQARRGGGRSKSNGGRILLPGQKTLQRYSKASLRQRKRNCQPATSFRVQGCCFFWLRPKRGGRNSRYLQKQAKREVRQTAQARTPKHPRPERQKGAGERPKSVRQNVFSRVNQSLESSPFFVSLQTSGFAYPNFFCKQVSHRLPSGERNLSRGWSLRYSQTLPESFLTRSPGFKRLSHQFSTRENLPSQ